MIESWRRSRSFTLMYRNAACMRSRRVLRVKTKRPLRETPQMCVKPRNVNVSGLPSPRRARRSAAYRPNSISRVFSGWSVSENLPTRSRNSVRNVVASSWCREIRTTMRRWQFYRQTDRDISDIARIVNPSLRGWLMYFGYFYRSELHAAVIAPLEEHLARWARRKYRSLRGHRRRSR